MPSFFVSRARFRNVFILDDIDRYDVVRGVEKADLVDVPYQPLPNSPSKRNGQSVFDFLIFSLLSLFWNKKFWEELISYFPW
jgi:hypothetical protein